LLIERTIQVPHFVKLATVAQCYFSLYNHKISGEYRNEQTTVFAIILSLSLVGSIFAHDLFLKTVTPF